MTQKEKDLLLKDLCARLPYGVKCIEKTPHTDFEDKNLWEIDRIRKDTIEFGMSNCYVCYGQYEDIHNIKPYLFPLSSITKEQEDELDSLDIGYGEYAFHDDIYGRGIGVDVAYKFYEWCYKNHVDFLGLIPMGLAIDATELNIY